MTTRELQTSARRLADMLIAKAAKNTGSALEEVLARTEKALPFLAEHCDEDTFQAVLFNALLRPALVKRSVNVLTRNYSVLRELLCALEIEYCSQVLGLIELDIGIVHLEKKDFETAVIHFERSLACDEQTGDTSGCIDTLWNLGLAQAGGEHLVEALACFERGLALLPADGDQGELARFEFKRGCVLADLKRFGEARRGLENALSKFLSINDMQGVEHTATRLVEICAELGDRLAAQRYIRLSMRLSFGLPPEHSED